MAASCLIPPNGHQKVLKAFTDVARKLNRGVSGSERFRPIIDGLLFGDENYKMKIGCMMLANAIVSTPRSLDFRMHLRNELIREGFNLGLEVGKGKIENETMLVHIIICFLEILQCVLFMFLFCRKFE